MQKKKPTDYFILTNLLELEAFDTKKFVSRNTSDINFTDRLPIGATLLFKAGTVLWTLIDYDNSEYMFAAANIELNDALKDTETGEFYGMPYHAFKISIYDFHLIFGFDRNTGVIPTNTLAILSNVVVRMDANGDLKYHLTSMYGAVARSFKPFTMKLLESLLVGFVPRSKEVTIKHLPIGNMFHSENPITYRIECTKSTDNSKTIEKLTLKNAMVSYVPEFKRTGDFINKRPVKFKL